MKFFQTKKDRTAQALEKSLIELSKSQLVHTETVAAQIKQTRIALLVLNGIDLASLDKMEAKIDRLSWLNREIEQRQKALESLQERSREVRDEINAKTFELSLIVGNDPDPDPEESDWQLTPARKAAIIKAADNLKALLERDPPPGYIETSRAAERISGEIDTNQY